MRRHLTYANVTATLALVLAMSGGALAAKHYVINSTTEINPKVLKSLDATDAAIFHRMARTATVAKAQTAVSALTAGSATSAGSATTAGSAGTAANATTASRALSATSALTAGSAETAADALALDGLGASSFTHSDCGSLTGQVKGFVTVPASGTFSGTFVPLPGYNCSGEAIEARRRAPGFYDVRFLGNPAAIAVGTVNAAGPGGVEDPPVVLVSVHSLAPGEWVVHLYEPDPGTQPDFPFELLVP
jgi:hypothetical protein